MVSGSRDLSRGFATNTLYARAACILVSWEDVSLKLLLELLRPLLLSILFLALRQRYTLA
jgi:hypothetical protein